MNNFDELNEQIENGEYFKEGYKWYHAMYMEIFYERSVLLLVFLLVLVVTLGISLKVYNMFPLNTKVSYLVHTTELFDKNSAIKVIKADNNKVSPQVALSKILAEIYVKDRESYNYDNLQQQIDRMHHTSTRTIFDNFYKNMSLNNPNSPLLTYQKNVTKHIYIINSKIITSDTVIVKFKAQVIDLNGMIIGKSSGEATVRFSVSDINMQDPLSSDFQFLVSGYETKITNKQ